MKTVLCISPHFPPINAPDMHRLRQSLPYFEEFGWRPIVFAVAPEYVEQSRDDLLLKSVPEGTDIHEVEAFSVSWTRQFGLGNLGIRSYLQYRRKVDDYLEAHDVDLIYFSTTVFTLMALGRYWKSKHQIPFILDLQDPWRNDYYLGLPRSKRPPKFWFDYHQKKFLEARTLPCVDGLVAVSDGYIETMRQRYPEVSGLDCLTLPFGALEADMKTAESLPCQMKRIGELEVVYVGRGGPDLQMSLSAIFLAFSRGLESEPEVFSRVRFRFLGTSYAPTGKGEQTILPIAKQYGVGSYVQEQTDRLPFFAALKVLQEADILFVPGSDDSDYTASKIFPYIQSRKPLLAVFHHRSSVSRILKECNAGEILTFSSSDSIAGIARRIQDKMSYLFTEPQIEVKTDWGRFEKYSARENTRKQCDYFSRVLAAREYT